MPTMMIYWRSGKKRFDFQSNRDIISLWRFIMSRKHGAGKGDTYRKVDQDRYRENYEKIFGKKKKKTNPKKKQGNIK